jgi:membrane-associated phospholipid phosphatase
VHYGGESNPIVLATQFFKPNPVAAMPSLHAGFPFLVFLVLTRVWPRWGWMSIVYPLAMSFAVVYMGEHYVIDVLAGFLYALVAFALIWIRLPGRHHQPAARHWQPKPAPVLAFTTRRILIARPAVRR